MNIEKLCIYMYTAVYSCLVLTVPDNPNLYTLTVDMVSSIQSFTACVTLQAFLTSLDQQTLLGGLGVQFLFIEELFILQFTVLRIVTNLAHEGLNSFYWGHLEIANYVLNSARIGCCISSSLLTMSVSRLVLIASPSFYQGINKKLYQQLAAMFNGAIFVSDFVINHVRCLLTHSKNYETPTVLHMRKEIGITFQMSNQSSFNTTSYEEFQNHTSYEMSTGSECTEIKLVATMLLLSTLIEAIKIAIFYIRIYRKAIKTQPLPPVKQLAKVQSRPNQQKRTNLRRSFSSGELQNVARDEGSHVFQSAFLGFKAIHDSSGLPFALQNSDTESDKQMERAHACAFHNLDNLDVKEIKDIVQPFQSSSPEVFNGNEKQRPVSLVSVEASKSKESLAMSQAFVWKRLETVEHERSLESTTHPFAMVDSGTTSFTEGQSLLESTVRKMKVRGQTDQHVPLQQLNIERLDGLDDHERVISTQQSSSQDSVETGTPGFHPTTKFTECTSERITANSRSIKQRRHSLPTLYLLDSKGGNKKKAQPISVKVPWKTLVYKPMKDFLLRSSTVPFILSIVGFIVLVKLLSMNDESSTESSIKLLLHLTRAYILILPVLLVLFDDQVVLYAKSFFVN